MIIIVLSSYTHDHDQTHHYHSLTMAIMMIIAINSWLPLKIPMSNHLQHTVVFSRQKISFSLLSFNQHHHHQNHHHHYHHHHRRHQTILIPLRFNYLLVCLWPLSWLLPGPLTNNVEISFPSSSGLLTLPLLIMILQHHHIVIIIISISNIIMIALNHKWAEPAFPQCPFGLCSRAQIGKQSPA